MNNKSLLKSIEEAKENGLDLSIGEDLSIALMNFISLEEHLAFSYMKTQDKRFLVFLNEIREIRKRHLAKIVKKDKKDDSENWCMSKHLLASAMRMIEVGNKFVKNKSIKDAEEAFDDAFNLYSLFWAMNNEKIGKRSVNENKMSKISQAIKKLVDCCKE